MYISLSTEYLFIYSQLLYFISFIIEELIYLFLIHFETRISDLFGQLVITFVDFNQSIHQYQFQIWKQQINLRKNNKQVMPRHDTSQIYLHII